MALDASEWSTSCSQPLNPHERTLVEASWNVMAHTQKTDFVFRRNGPVHLNGRGRQFSQLLAAEVCASAVVMLDTPCSEVVWRVLATHSVRQFPLHFPSRVSPCAITFQLKSTHCLEAGWALESIWITWRREISLDPARIWNLDHPACSLPSIFITQFCVAKLNCGSKEASPFPFASLHFFITDLTM
jgi:hypothetical protein